MKSEEQKIMAIMIHPNCHIAGIKLQYHHSVSLF